MDQTLAPDASSAAQHELPVSSDALIAALRAAGIAFESYDHAPLRTVEDAKQVQHAMLGSEAGGYHIKNLYLRDRKKRNYLMTVEQDRAVDLKALGAAIGAQNPSFGSADRLMEHLGIRPGAVSPLAMVTGAETGVVLVLERALKEARLVHMHPLVNDRTVAMAPADLLRWLESLGVTPVWID